VIRARCVVLVAALAAAGTALGSNEQPKAFDRPMRATDALPKVLRTLPTDRFGLITAIRRVATYDGGPNRRAREYVFRTERGYWCEAFVWRGVGMGCSPGSIFAGRHVAAGAGQFLSGIASNDVTRIVIVGSQGVRHRVALSADNGFIYDCRTYNGCTCAVAWLDAYAGTRRVAHQDWYGSSCRKSR
jgi:hypothetical protein